MSRLQALLLAVLLPAIAPIHCMAQLMGEESRAAPASKAVRSWATGLEGAGRLVLAAPVSVKLATDAGSGGARQIGIERGVDRQASAVATANIRWNDDGAGGMVGRIAVRSEGASALRIAVALAAAPAGTQLRFGNASGAAGQAADAAAAVAATQRWGMFWGPVIPGDEGIVEVRLAAGTPVSGVQLSVASVSHLVVDPSKGGTPPSGAKASGTCQHDVACTANPAPALLQASRSVAKIVYTYEGATYACSGTLVNDGDASSQIPYVLTAKHCIDSAATAATVNTYWFLEAPRCGQSAPSNTVVLAGGARLEYASAVNDIALLRLNDAAPAGAWFSGIDASVVATGESAVALHHPQGDLKKISSGVVADPSGTSGRHVLMSWLSGTTEPGSSGSGLFTEKNGQYVLRGTLRGGSASCSNSGSIANPDNRDFYSRLDGDIEAMAKLMRSDVAPAADYSDLWAVTTETANGVTITQRPNGAVFAVWFTYDAAGSPMWLMMPAAAWTSPNAFSGTVFRVNRNAATPAQEAVGSVSFEFASSDRGSMRVNLAGQPERAMEVQRYAF